MKPQNSPCSFPHGPCGRLLNKGFAQRHLSCLRNSTNWSTQKPVQLDLSSRCHTSREVYSFLYIFPKFDLGEDVLFIKSGNPYNGLILYCCHIQASTRKIQAYFMTFSGGKTQTICIIIIIIKSGDFYKYTVKLHMQNAKMATTRLSCEGQLTTVFAGERRLVCLLNWVTGEVFLNPQSGQTTGLRWLF